MTIDYGAIASEAAAAIALTGRKAELRRDSGSRECTLVDVGDGRHLSGQERNGELIRFTDRIMLVSAVDLDPAPDPEEDQLVLDGHPHRIVVSVPLQPADTVLVYEMMVRR